MASKLQPIIKWPGGKEKELGYILPNIPSFNGYFEPFVGGGSVFMAVDATEYHINDLSHELISLYNNISLGNNAFYKYVEAIALSWDNVSVFLRNNGVLASKYLEYRDSKIDKDELLHFLSAFCVNKAKEIGALLTYEFANLSSVLVKEVEKNLSRKMLRMRCLEDKKHLLPDSDISDNVEAAIKSALYMSYRNLYNNKLVASRDIDMHSALFFFIRNYAYSGMFRYSSKGEFNVPYGGIAYNSKSLTKKIDYYRSQQVKERFAQTHIYNLDFEGFLNKTNPTENDFVFLDPPYDTEFSTYAQNSFTRTDHIRLANYLVNKCKAKWMLIIKNTDFIFNLYNDRGVRVKTFDKEYVVSFMNRNDKKATHLMITNY